MRNQFLVTCAAAMACAALPAMGAISVHQCCVPGAPTAASYTWNFKGEADHIFRQIQFDALNARYNSDQMVTVDRFDQLGWIDQGQQLTNLRHDINDMGAKLCRLEIIQSALAPWQRREVGRIAAVLPLMADNTTDAIHFLNARESDFWMPQYQKYTSNLYAESRQMVRTSDQAVDYAHVWKEYRDLGHQMGA